MRKLFSEADIAALNGLYEDRSIEVKQAVPNTDKLVQIMQGFANGIEPLGNVVVGLAEDDSGQIDSAAILPVPYPVQPEGMGAQFANFDELKLHLFEKFRSSTAGYFEGMFEMREVPVHIGTVIVIEVPQSQLRPHRNTVNRHFYIRGDGQNRPMSELEIDLEYERRFERRSEKSSAIKFAPTFEKYVLVLEGPPSDEARVRDRNTYRTLLSILPTRLIRTITVLPLGLVDAEPMVFDFSQGNLPPSVSVVRDTGGTYLSGRGTEVVMAAEGEPRFEEISPGIMGLLLEWGTTNLLCGSAIPESQSDVPVTPGYPHVLWVVGSGAAILSGAAEGRAVEGHPLVFAPKSSDRLNVTVEGELTRFQLEAGDTPTSFIPSPEGATVVRDADTLVLGGAID